MPSSPTNMEIITVSAIFLGPVFAVLVTRCLDKQRIKKSRRFDLFRDLMRTRQARLDPTHVGALNLVEVEFYNHPKVVGSFRAYLRHLGSPMPAPDEQKRYFDDRDDLFIEMIRDIGEAVGYKFDKHDLSRLSYIPKGWEDDQNILRFNAQRLSEILSGQRALPITPHNSMPKALDPYPPRPD